MKRKQDPRKWANDAGFRLVVVEIDLATSLLARMDRVRDREQRVECLKEARAAVELAARLAAVQAFPDGYGEEIAACVEHLRHRLEEVAAMEAGSGG